MSVVSNQTISSPMATYNSQFKYRWTDKYLATGVVSIVPGEKTKIQLTADKSINVLIPKEGKGNFRIVFFVTHRASNYLKKYPIL